MTMSHITKERDILTLVITLEVKPENCDALRDLITRETMEFVRHQPGFVSANLHRNAESTRLVNYGQWESRALYRRARDRDEFKAFSKDVEALAEGIDVTVCDVVFTEERAPPQGSARGDPTTLP
jgi:quinol monooxygenase YgiN